MSEDVDLDVVAKECPPNFTGADLYSLCSDALISAVKRKISLFEEKLLLLNKNKTEKEKLTPNDLFSEMKEDDFSVSVSQEDFLSAIKTVTPSVSEKELVHYQNLQKSYTKNIF